MWLQKLLDTYENNIETYWNQEPLMAPVSHIVKSAQIEISLDAKGNLLSIKALEKGTEILIPVTEESAGRTSAPVPHALCDMLPYVAADYKEYCKTEKERNSAREKHELYITQLEKWANDEKNSHSKTKAIYQYLSSNNVAKDCIDAGILSLEGPYFDKGKVAGQPYEKSVVCFRVKEEEKAEGTWEDYSLITSYIDYYQRQPNQPSSLCCMTGKNIPVGTIHPKGIIAASYGAKLISSGDISCFTYRGRFETAEQAMEIGYEPSQKIHSALSWVVKKYGTYLGSTDRRMLILWNPKGKELPSLDDSIKEEDDKDQKITAEDYRKKLQMFLKGYGDRFTRDDEVIIMGLEAATTGRLSVTYYQELSASDYLENMRRWREECKWYFLFFTKEKQPYQRIHSPNFFRIAECAFGHEKGAFWDVEDKLMKEHVQVLTKCMLEGQAIPYYFVSNLVRRSSELLKYTRYHREQLLSITCSVIMKNLHDKKQVTPELSELMLDKHSMDASYLFGRLLAIYEEIEESTYTKDQLRDTNALRLQKEFVNRPLATAQLLEVKLLPYLEKQKPYRRSFFRNKIKEVMSLLYITGESSWNQRLKETYLIGYCLQKQEFLSGEAGYF